MSDTPITILAIESSCDDTAAAIVRNGAVVSNHTATQKVHERFGGVVPEMASRAHILNIIPVVDAAISDAGIKKTDISAVAFTRCPGLIGSLMVGACFAKGFAQALDKPLIDVHHMQAHVLAHFIDNKPEFPFLCLTVSGGHTQIVLVRDFLDMEVIGQTIDDAAGEAFDKIAKMLGLPYPGGPMVDKLAQMGDPEKFKFPLSEMPEYRFSFSGLKTSVLYFLQAQEKKEADFKAHHLNDICASVQATIIKMLMTKLTRAAKDLGIKNVGIAGGVSANSGLRKALADIGSTHGWKVFIPKFEYCTDNAAMVGITAYYKYLNGQFCDLSAVPSAKATW
jgi:N6-L-threonylcarbamoyladenine synthase